MKIDKGYFKKIGGIEQFLYEGGEDENNDVILFLHGGPGLPYSFKGYLLEHWYQYFTVVHWDQRGAGKTAIKNPHVHPTFETMISDIDEIVQFLCEKYGKERVIIFGHSWGTVIGSIYAHDHPERVLCYVGVGQVIDAIEDESTGFQETLRRAKESGDQNLVHVLDSVMPYNSADTIVLEKMVKVREVQKALGIASYSAEKDQEILHKSPLYTPEDDKARNLSLPLLDKIYEEFPSYSIRNLQGPFKVPVFFLLGEEDWQVPVVQGVKYFEELKAPLKGLLILKGAKHNPMLETKEVFLEKLVEVVKKAKEFWS